MCLHVMYGVSIGQMWESTNKIYQRFEFPHHVGVGIVVQRQSNHGRSCPRSFWRFHLHLSDKAITLLPNKILNASKEMET